jgi:hypothetical protein
MKCLAYAEPSDMTLFDAPMEVQGDWGKSSPQAAAVVLSRMRAACLTGVKLLSDRQPRRIRVENHATGSPAIWLHDDGSPMAWIIVDIGERDWSKLAYQFGHELGHVLANSWGPDSKPQNPCQWLEEALVEAFSLHGLSKLADSWEQRPPFTNDAAFAKSIRQYRRRIIEKYKKIAAEQVQNSRIDAWFGKYRLSLEQNGTITGPARAMVAAILKEIEASERSIEDLGALNRWPGRSSVSMEDYLQLWQKSCDEIGAIGWLPKRVSDLFGMR